MVTAVEATAATTSVVDSFYSPSICMCNDICIYINGNIYNNNTIYNMIIINDDNA